MFKGVWKLNLISSTPNRDGIHATTWNHVTLLIGEEERLRVEGEGSECRSPSSISTTKPQPSTVRIIRQINVAVPVHTYIP